MGHRSVRLSVGWLVGRSVCSSVYHNFLKGREVTLPCYYQSTCSSMLLNNVITVIYWYNFMNMDQAQVEGHTRSTHTVAYMYVHYIVISFVNYISC